MPRLDYKTCKACKRHSRECGLLSHTRLCRRCSEDRAVANYDDLRAHSGPWFYYWRTRIVASVGGVLLDDLQAKP